MDKQIVLDALKNFYNHMAEVQYFNLDEFLNFMEPKFSEAGYRTAGDVKNILLIHDSGIGDFILMTGAIREIRKIYPNSKIKLVTHQNDSSLVDCCPYVDEIILNARTTDWKNFLEVYAWNLEIAEKLLTEKIDLCYSFTYFISSPLLMYMSGAVKRVSYFFERDENSSGGIGLPSLNDLATVSVPRYFCGVHNVDINFSLIGYGREKILTNRTPEVWCKNSDVRTAKNFLGDVSKKFYALCMGGTHPRKHYPPEKYAELVKMILAEEYDANFIIFGGGESDKNSAEILKNILGEKICAEKIIDLTNKLNYRETVAALSFCKFYIGNDTGVMHIAAAVNCPVLVTFAFPADLPENIENAPKRFHPYGVPCVVVQAEHALKECKKNEPYTHYGCRVADTPHCITQITPKTLFKGFQILKSQTDKKFAEPIFICS